MSVNLCIIPVLLKPHTVSHLLELKSYSFATYVIPTTYKMFKSSHLSKIIITIVFKMSNFLVTSGYNEKKKGVIYILVWTSITPEFYLNKMGSLGFKDCPFNNCFLTNDKYYFESILDFEVLIFNNVHMGSSPMMELPTKRSPKQIYCMYGVEPGAYHPLPISVNYYFNMTFTYKLSSNITFPYVIIRDDNDVIIGPKIDMEWIKLEDMRETSDDVKDKLQNKTIAAAWIVSHCESPWRRIYAEKLQTELNQYGHRLDIFGKCGTINCPVGNMKDICYAAIELDYYFYLSFENSYGEDYVTEKILNALEHFTVPVVLGGADYRRFMPEGTYLNANQLTPAEMAKRMNEIINDKQAYYNFFKWHEHYSFHAVNEDNYQEQYCKLCAYLNNNMNKTSIVGLVAQWWNEAQPPWPENNVDYDPPNAVEIFFRTVLDFLD